MARRNIWKLAVALAGATLLAALSGWVLMRWSSDRWVKRVTQIKEGMSEREARAVAGDPTSVATAPFGTELGRADADCARRSTRALVYKHGGLSFLVFVGKSGRIECSVMVAVLVTRARWPGPFPLTPSQSTPRTPAAGP